MPYIAMRSTVSSAKKSATTIGGDHDGHTDDLVEHGTLLLYAADRVAASATETARTSPPVARSIRRPLRRSRPRCSTTNAWNTPGPTADAGRFAFWTSRQVAGAAQSAPAPE